jgi:hypothetical protein
LSDKKADTSLPSRSISKTRGESSGAEKSLEESKELSCASMLSVRQQDVLEHAAQISAPAQILPY